MGENPPAAIQLVAQLKVGHDDRAWHVAWNPKRPILASCSADKTVRMYHYQLQSIAEDSEDSKLGFVHSMTIPTGHAKTVRAIAWSPSGKTLATASFDSNIGIWAQEEDNENGDVSGGDAEWECMSLLEGHETECKSIAYSAGGNLLASCSRDKTVWVWEVHPDYDFECMGVLMEHSQDVKCVAWHPTEEILASASYDDTIKLYLDDPTEDWYCFATLTGHESTVWSLAFSPDGRFLASSSDDLTVRIWEHLQGNKWECAAVLEGHERSIYSVSWGKGKATREGSLGWLASTGSDGLVLIHELIVATQGIDGGKSTLSHTVVASLPSAHDVSDVNTVVWCPREGLEDVFGTAGDDGLVKVWRVKLN
ncbi:WD40 repeat-like protein [Fomitopsis betulina]|nr:WD40 repeat-like protein [Fomitopsis betulina]